MKNIHVLPTDKPSRLAGSEYITNVQGIDKRVFKFKLWNKFIDNKDLKAVGYIPHNIYITSDEEILVRDYYISSHEASINQCFDFNKETLNKAYWAKKIILTTDQDLIKDGVQAIDDEFLEWFVKNPSCEEVEVNHFGMCCSNQLIAQCINCNQYNPVYKIIIPKEESKQETLEEAAHEYFKRGQLGFEKASDTEEAFLKGAKWMQERMYSEEELEVAFFEGRENNLPFTEWFEKFKKK